jgi:serine/threonine protein kinase
MLEGRLPLEVDGLRFERSLGRGAMGEVFAGRDLRSGLAVAVKLLPRWRNDDPLALERFRREGQLMARITHPNCVRVFEAREVGGIPALVMELMSGASLQGFLFDEPQPVERVVDWTVQVLDGLAAAHDVGVLHRDIKPANCFLDFVGSVKLGDFGLARLSAPGATITGLGASIGTPLYAAPEQLRGERVDERADIYAAGALLYALLCGLPAFYGRTLTDTIVAIQREPPESLAQLCEGLPAGLERCVSIALAKRREERFPTARAFRDALAPFMARPQ